MRRLRIAQESRVWRNRRCARHRCPMRHGDESGLRVCLSVIRVRQLNYPVSHTHAISIFVSTASLFIPA